MPFSDNAGQTAGSPKVLPACKEPSAPKLNDDFTSISKFKDTGRWYVNSFVKLVSESLPPGTTILDAGAGECAYKKYFSHCWYVSVDLAIGEESWNYGNLDYIAPLDNLPFADKTFEAILCTEVLEHLEQPRETVKELFRVLKPGGKLFLTVPMAHGEHQVPHDFFRYTSYGLRSICSEAGFNEVAIAPLGGMFTRWAYEIPLIMSLFPGAGIRSGKINLKGLALLPLRLLCSAAVRAAQGLAFRLRPLRQGEKFPAGLVCNC